MKSNYVLPKNFLSLYIDKNYDIKLALNYFGFLWHS